LNGSVVNTLAGDGASPHPTAVQVELDGLSIQHTGVSTIASGVSEHGVAFAVLGLPSSSMPPLTLTIASARANDGQVGIAVVVSGGNFFDAGVIWLVAPPPSDAPVPAPGQTGLFSGSFFVASADPKTFRPDLAADERSTGGSLGFEAAAGRALLAGVPWMGELLRRASTAAGYIGWSGRDDPRLALELTAGATSTTSATALNAGPKPAAVDLAHAPPSSLSLKEEADQNTLPVDPSVMTATVVPAAVHPEWIAEADTGRRILPEDEPLNALPSPQPRRVKARASARGLALLAISITATWIYGHGAPDLTRPRNPARPRCRR
jgi:hypothetical protein